MSCPFSLENVKFRETAHIAFEDEYITAYQSTDIDLSVEFGYENGIRVFLKRATDGLYVKLNVANNVHELQHILWALGKDANLKI